MTNGKTQSAITIFTGIVTAAAVVGAVWNRMSTNAAAARAAIEEIRIGQKEIAKKLDILIAK